MTINDYLMTINDNLMTNCWFFITLDFSTLPFIQQLMTINDSYIYLPTEAFFNFQTLKLQTPVKPTNDHP